MLNKTVINTSYDKITGMLEVHKSLYRTGAQAPELQLPLSSTPTWQAPGLQISRSFIPKKNSLNSTIHKYNNGQNIQVSPDFPHM